MHNRLNVIKCGRSWRTCDKDKDEVMRARNFEENDWIDNSNLFTKAPISFSEPNIYTYIEANVVRLDI